MNFDKMGGGGGLVPETKGGGLARQLSVYSLTFDQFQSTHSGIGKDFSSMNMDELLKNIWTAEESQAMAGASAAGFSDVGLQKQGSYTLPRTLSQKTVDEVWRDLVNPPQVPSTNGAAHGVSHQHRQLMLGEMTLEEFLVRAGVVREEPVAPAAVLPQRSIGDSSKSRGNKNTAINNVIFGDLPVASNGNGPVSNTAAANLAMMATTADQSIFGVVDLGNSQGIRGGGLVGVNEAGMSAGLMPGPVGFGAAAGRVAIASTANNLPTDSMGKSGRDQSSVSPVPYVFSGGLRVRKSNAKEKVFERRQRRMIKNRESATRSRARKQAYTMELEAEVAKLKELNQELQKKQMEVMEMQKNKVLEMIEQQRGPKKRCLRRTQTGPW